VAGTYTGVSDLVVPAGVVVSGGSAVTTAPTGTVTINGEATIGSTLAAATAVTLNEGASLTVAAATFALATSVSLGDGSTLTVGNAAAFTALDGTGTKLITSSGPNGTGKIVGAWAATPANFLKVLTVAGTKLNVTLTGDVTLAANNTVQAGTVLTIGSGGKITADSTTGPKQLVIEGDVVLDGGTLAIANADTTVADITLAQGKTITAGNIVITATGASGSIDTNMANTAFLAKDLLTLGTGILVLTDIKIEAGDVANNKGILVKAGKYTTGGAATRNTEDITARGPEVGRAVLNIATSFQFTTASGIDFGSLSTLHAAVGNSETFLPASLTAGAVTVNFKAGARVSAGTSAAWVKTGDIITTAGVIYANNTFYVLTADEVLNNTGSGATWIAKVAF
jgi:hypothetical protein